MPDDQIHAQPGPLTHAEHGQNQTGQSKRPDPPPVKPARWPWAVAGLIVAGFVVFALVRALAPKPDVWTEDAYVMAHYAVVAPRISGQIETILVDDNQPVRAGQLIVTIDPRDAKQSVALAQAQLDRDIAQTGDVEANLQRQPALIDQQRAEVDSARAKLNFAQTNQRRYANLASTGAGTEQQRQQTDAERQEDQAALDSAQAALEAARRQTEVLKQQKSAAQAALEAARRQTEVLKQQKSAAQADVEADRARLEQAKLNFSYTRIYAPVDGMVAQRAAQVGNIVAPGAALLVVVPLDRVYVVANYRETDLRHVAPGQRAKIHLDAYDVDLDGIVDGVPPASGATFSPTPPNNATGNFTKIVQRLPVKIVAAPDQPLARLLRVGFSVETTIHTGLADVTSAAANMRPGPQPAVVSAGARSPSRAQGPRH